MLLRASASGWVLVYYQSTWSMGFTDIDGGQQGAERLQDETPLLLGQEQME